MLVLSRKLNESIVINGDIIITIVGLTADGRIRLGIEAPRDVSVHRREVYDAIKREQGKTDDPQLKEDHCPFKHPECANGCFFPYKCARPNDSLDTTKTDGVS